MPAAFIFPAPVAALWPLGAFARSSTPADTPPCMRAGRPSRNPPSRALSLPGRSLTVPAYVSGGSCRAGAPGCTDIYGLGWPFPPGQNAGHMNTRRGTWESAFRSGLGTASTMAGAAKAADDGCHAVYDHMQADSQADSDFADRCRLAAGTAVSRAKRRASNCRAHMRKPPNSRVRAGRRRG